MIPASLSRALEAAGQSHLLGALERLEQDAAAHARLLAQVEALDLELVARLAALARTPSRDDATARTFDPPELFPLERSAEHEQAAERAAERGEELLRAGRVGCVLVAGGQASRLGIDAPKGTLPVGPVTGRSLYEVHARRLLAARRRYDEAVPWYVMTSPANDAATREFFERHGWFGLAREDVFFFAQEMLPALDTEGRILRSATDSLFLAPNGHGGVLSGLARSGALDDLEARGIEQLAYFQVDNPLVRPLDPLFLGLHADAGAGMSSKVVEKRSAAEKVGVIGKIDGRMGCIEYSDLPEELREARDAEGRLRFRAGNIAVHVIATPFLREVSGGSLELPWHVARKRMKVVDESGAPAEVDGFKFETFVFDALAESEASVTLEVDRASEFSPVKNAEGEDSPATARADLCALYAGWTRAAGARLPEPDDEGNHPVEVDPLFAQTESEFLAHGSPEPEVRDGGYLFG